MFVIILHPSEELKLIKLQKELISKLWNPTSCFDASYPLWIPFDFPVTNLKQDSKKIKKVTIDAPLWENNDLFCKVTININDEIICSKLNLLQDIKKSCKEQNIPAGLSLDFPLNIKIFRLGIAVNNPEEHSTAIQDSVWCKLA